MYEDLQGIPDYFGHQDSIRAKHSFWVNGEPIPWMSYPAIAYLMQIDFSTKKVFEYGGGASTLFWARRAAKVVTVENDQSWFEACQETLAPNVEMHLLQGEDYVRCVANGAPHDVIVIDGRWRYDCAMYCGEFLADGGFIILDNSERHPQITQKFRDDGLMQIDFIGFAPQLKHISSTSFFFRRDCALQPLSWAQPRYMPGMMDSAEYHPDHRADDNRPGSPS